MSSSLKGRDELFTHPPARFPVRFQVGRAGSRRGCVVHFYLRLERLFVCRDIRRFQSRFIARGDRTICRRAGDLVGPDFSGSHHRDRAGSVDRNFPPEVLNAGPFCGRRQMKRRPC